MQSRRGKPLTSRRWPSFNLAEKSSTMLCRKIVKVVRLLGSGTCATDYDDVVNNHLARRLRIHGDNIVECERALQMLADSMSAMSPIWTEGPVYAPEFLVSYGTNYKLFVQLLPGYGRWKAEITAALSDAGAPLAEAADAIITEYKKGVRQCVSTEELLVAIEFCGALPAGNNAWQRCGRSYSYTLTGVPYLYVSEFGGYELSAERTLKNPRYPNPIVPFAYAVQSKNLGSSVYPVYTPSPSISETINEHFGSVWGWQDALGVIGAIVRGDDSTQFGESLVEKGLAAAIEIASLKKSRKGLNDTQWRELFAIEGLDRVRYLAQLAMPWAKRITIPTTHTLEELQTCLQAVALSSGSSDLPFGLVAENARPTLARNLKKIYAGIPQISSGFIHWLGSTDKPLVVVMMAGFKPRGDDSRPDRGLLPLVRMLFGEEVDVLTVVYGPGSKSTWAKFMHEPLAVAANNGLWQTVFSLGDAIFVDSMTAPHPTSHLIHRDATPLKKNTRIVIEAASTSPKYNEQDVDTAIKMMAAGEGPAIFEGLCNPPGGDWSGISLTSENGDIEYRWTSLPRVTGDGGKRPDHVLQFTGIGRPHTILSIESKDRYQDFEQNIGPRLVAYVNDLLQSPATISRSLKSNGGWKHNTDIARMQFKVLSAGAFVYSGSVETVMETMRQNGLDIAIAFSFHVTEPSVARIVCTEESSTVVAALIESAKKLQSRLIVEVYGLEDCVQ